MLAPRPLDYQKTFSAFLPKVSLAFAATPDWTVGGLVSRGYNPGGVSLNLTTRNWAYFKEETISNYELFTRASLLDGRLLLNGNLFFMDFKDAQYNIPVVVSPGWRSRTPSTPRRPTPTAWSWTSTTACATTCG